VKLIPLFDLFLVVSIPQSDDNGATEPAKDVDDDEGEFDIYQSR